MSALAERTRLSGLAGGVRTSTTPWVLALTVLCAAIGVTAGVDPKYGIAAVLALVFTVVVLANLTVGLAMFAALSFLDILNIGGPAVSFMKVAGLIIFVSWLARASTDSRRRARALVGEHPWMVAALVGLVAWSALSAAWAASPGDALITTYRYALDFLLIPIAYAAIREPKHAHVVIAGFLIGAVVSAAYGLVVPTASTALQAGRLTGALGEANQQATALVAGLALMVGVSGALKRSPALLAAALAGAVIAFLGLLDTESRAGLLSFGCVLLAGVALGGRWRRIAALLVIAGAVAVVGYFAFVAPTTALHRVTSADTSGRSSLWTIGWRAFTAHPILGSGAGNFQVVSVHYLDRPGTITAAFYIVDRPLVVHNIYLEQLADVGIPGLVILLCIFVAAGAAALKAAHIFERIGDRDLELLSRCVVLALVAFLTADFFASELPSKQLWLVIALCPALLALARSRAAAAPGPRW
ncbi:MAG TPA: O-antigen ligase family protein [Solirubrobacteraceae bacterium]|nr:O-antigen ligase family protein [Solirubrobacteraceae bacterium]